MTVAGRPFRLATQEPPPSVLLKTPFQVAAYRVAGVAGSIARASM